MESEEISFGRFRLDLGRRELRRDSEPLRLHRRALGILCALAEAKGDIVSKDELMRQLWPGRTVEEGNLHVNVSVLRKALGEHDEGYGYIVTVPGRGYRLAGLIGAVSADSAAASSARPPPLPDKPSIAVLPFQNMCGDPEQDYFVDGMVEEIITALSRTRSLFVIAHNSTFTYKGRVTDVKQVGLELGVRYVLEGSVRKVGSRVRIAVQLAEAASRARLWADRFDSSVEEVFALQERVALSAAGIIQPELQAAEVTRLADRPTTDLTAYDLYLRACAMFLSTARRIPEALYLMEQAIARDPGYGPALAWAAVCCYRLVLDGRSDDPARDRLKGSDFARRALEVAGDDPETRANAAVALAYFGEDIDAMMALIDRALQLNPSFARGWSISAMRRLWAGQPEVAIEHAETALRLSPRARVGSPILAIGAAHFLKQRFDQALPKLLLAVQDDPGFPEPHRFLAACYAHMGRLADAKNVLSRLRAITPVIVPDAIYLRNPEQRELFLSGLRLATAEEA